MTAVRVAMQYKAIDSVLGVASLLVASLRIHDSELTVCGDNGVTAPSSITSIPLPHRTCAAQSRASSAKVHTGNASTLASSARLQFRFDAPAPFWLLQRYQMLSSDTTLLWHWCRQQPSTRLHKPTMHFKSQTQFGDILWTRERSVGALLDPA